MSVRRSRLTFENHYAQIPNAWLRDRRLSRKARGLLAELMSHREGFVVSVAALVANGPEGRDAIVSGLAELREAGYLTVAQGRADGGRFGEVEYLLAEPSPQPDYPGAVDPLTVHPTTGNPTPKKTKPLEDHSGEEHSRASALDLEIEEGPRIIPSRKPVRPDVERLAIEGTRVFAVSDEKARVDANARRIAELILDERKTSPDEVVEILRWATSDDFWGPKVLSWSKLREHFVQLRKQSSVSGPARTPASAAPAPNPATAGSPAWALVGAGEATRQDRARVLLSRAVDPARYYAHEDEAQAFLERVIALPAVHRSIDLAVLYNAWANRDQSGRWSAPSDVVWVEARV